MRGASEFVERVAVGDVRRRENGICWSTKAKRHGRRRRRRRPGSCSKKTARRCTSPARSSPASSRKTVTQPVDTLKTLAMSSTNKNSISLAANVIRERGFFRALQRILASRHEAGTGHGFADAHSRTIETVCAGWTISRLLLLLLLLAAAAAVAASSGGKFLLYHHHHELFVVNIRLRPDCAFNFWDFLFHQEH